MYAVIMAGGGGSRLWPYSRAHTPKQLLAVATERTLIQETVDRLLPLMPAENIVVVTGPAHVAGVREQLPELPQANILVEPAACGTAPAIGLGLLHVAGLAAARGETDPVVGSFHADHVITDPEAFRSVVRDAVPVAEAGFIVTIGIMPDRPHTGYGYIKRGEKLPAPLSHAAYRVSRFVEKPDPATAVAYLETGSYTWNSGIFVWKYSTIMGEYERYLPALYAQLAEIRASAATLDTAAILARVWGEVQPMTIDVGIAERSRQMAVIPADFGWSDVGDWSAVAELLAARGTDDGQNAVIGLHLTLDTHNSLIVGTVPGKLVATIGLENIAVVDTGDALLVCDLSRNQDVKLVVEQLKALGLDQFL